MEIKKNISGTECELLLMGRIDGPAAHQFEVEVLEMARTDLEKVYVNLSAANFLCSAAIRVILQHHRQWKQRGKSFVVVRTSPEVDQILEMTGLRDLVMQNG